MIDTDKYEGLNEVIDRIIDSDEIGIDDLLADSMAVKNGIKELLTEVKRWKGNWTFLRDWLVKHINNEKTNLTARAFSEFFLQLMDGRDEVSE